MNAKLTQSLLLSSGVLLSATALVMAGQNLQIKYLEKKLKDSLVANGIAKDLIIHLVNEVDGDLNIPQKLQTDMAAWQIMHANKL